MLSQFPPQTVRLKVPFSIKPWIGSEDNVGKLLMVIMPSFLLFSMIVIFLKTCSDPKPILLLLLAKDPKVASVHKGPQYSFGIALPKKHYIITVVPCFIYFISLRCSALVCLSSLMLFSSTYVLTPSINMTLRTH
jgi:hypothetical protein